MNLYIQKGSKALVAPVQAADTQTNCSFAAMAPRSKPERIEQLVQSGNSSWRPIPCAEPNYERASRPQPPTKRWFFFDHRLRVTSLARPPVLQCSANLSAPCKLSDTSKTCPSTLQHTKTSSPPNTRPLRGEITPTPQQLGLPGHDDHAIGGGQLGDISADGVAELVAQRPLEEALGCVRRRTRDGR